MNLETLVDDIYEASVVPERWLHVLDRLTELGDGEGATLFSIAPGIPRWLATPGLRDLVDRWTKSPFALKNPRIERVLMSPETRFLTDLDILTMQELETSEFYNLARSQGLGWAVGTTIRAPSGDMLVMSVEKAWSKGPVPREVAETLDGLRPHLARASVLSSRLGLERARAAVATLELLGLPAAVVTPSGRAIAVNDGFLASGPGVSVVARDQVQFESHAVQTMFIEALTAKPLSLAQTGRSIPVAGTALQTPMIAHVLPLRRSGLEVFAGAASIVYLTPVVQQRGPAPALLQALFDLTPAEARVTSMLVNGMSVDSISKAQNVSLNTIRTHLKAVFVKTGVERQVELVSLLGQRRPGS